MRPSCPALPRLLSAAGLLLASAAATAHTGTDGGTHHGLAAGLLHPFTGLDHLAAMLAVGLWSGLVQPGGRALWAAPAAFASLLLVGALAAAAGLALPAVEPMIAVSLLVLGLLLALQRALPVPAAAALVGSFALFHGAAHGLELSGAAALAGMLLGTALLHLCGIVAGRWLASRQAAWPRPAGRTLGAGIALFGVTLLLA